MFAKTSIAAALISLGALAAIPSQASADSLAMPSQASADSLTVNSGAPTWTVGHDKSHKTNRLSAKHMRWLMHDRGYANIRFHDDRGSLYQMSAWKHGKKHFLIVNSHSGKILSSHKY